jgi:N-methylhydantoinase A
MTAVRIRVIGQIPPIPLPEAPPHDGSALEASEWRRIFHQGRHIDVPVYVRGRLNVGQHLTGPAIVEQEDCTIWVIPDWQGKTDATGNLILSKSK